MLSAIIRCALFLIEIIDLNWFKKCSFRTLRQREEYEKSKSYDSWVAEQQTQPTRAQKAGASQATKGAAKRPEAKEDLRTRVRNIMSRYKLDDSLNAYEQWLKDRGGLESEAGTSTLPYQTMIREFCDKNCPHHCHWIQRFLFLFFVNFLFSNVHFHCIMLTVISTRWSAFQEKHDFSSQPGLFDACNWDQVCYQIVIFLSVIGLRKICFVGLNR